jgi:hypothetical protein
MPCRHLGPDTTKRASQDGAARRRPAALLHQGLPSPPRWAGGRAFVTVAIGAQHGSDPPARGPRLEPNAVVGVCRCRRHPRDGMVSGPNGGPPVKRSRHEQSGRGVP